MKRDIAYRWIFLSILTCAAVATNICGQEPAKPKEAETTPRKLDPAEVRKLIAQLQSVDFKVRERAAQELSNLHDVPDALREAIKSGDLELKRRAETVVAVITARAEERIFKATAAELQKIEVDRFVRRMITDAKFAGDEEWKMIEKLAKAVTKRANDLGGRKYAVPDFDMKSLALADLTVERVGFNSKRLLLRETDSRSTSIRGCVVLCAGNMPRTTSLTNSIVIVDGDFTGATGIDNSLLIVRGNIGRFTGITKSIIIATGNLEGATVCNESFLQVSNQRIRFTGSRDCVLIKTAVNTTGATNSQILDTDKGPLQLLKFSVRKSDDELIWGKEVNGLAVAIYPADQRDRFLIRWKNVGNDTLDVPWVRFNSDLIDSNRDDLLHHVLLKGPDGNMAAARKYPPSRAGAPPGLTRSVILAPGKTFEEVTDLWRYLERFPVDGRFELSIEPELSGGRFRLERDARAWTGKIQSNVIEINFGK